MESKIYGPKKIQFSGVLNLSSLFWLTAIAGMLDRFIIEGFTQNAAEMLQTKFNLSLQMAGSLMAIPDIILVCLCPFLAIVLDKFGKRGYVLVVGFCFETLSQLSLGFTTQCPLGEVCMVAVFPLVLLGIGTCLVKLTVFTCINLIVPERYYGTSIGILYAMQNLSLLISSLLCGEVLEIGSHKWR